MNLRPNKTPDDLDFEKEHSVLDIIVYILLLALGGVAIYLLMSTITRPKEDINLEAFCKSIGGEYGSKVCYKDGHEVSP